MNSNHNRIKELLPLYIDNELSEKDEADVLEHLAECDTCQNDLNMLMEIQSAIKLDMIPLPDGFHEATMARIEQEVHQAPKASPFDYRRYIHVASLVLLVAIIGTIGFRLTDRSQEMDEGMATGSIMVTEETGIEEEPEISTFAGGENTDDVTLKFSEDMDASQDEEASDDQVVDNRDTTRSVDSDGDMNSASTESHVADTAPSSRINEEAVTTAQEAQQEVLAGDSIKDETESIGNFLWIFIPLGFSVLIGLTYVYRQRRKIKDR